MKKGIILKRDNLGLLIESEKQKYRAEMSKAEAAAYKEGMPVAFDLATNEKGKEVAVNVQTVTQSEPPQKTAPDMSNPDVYNHQSKDDVIRPPYHFVPIPTKGGQVVGVTDTPVFHDGAQAGKGNLWSGELRCAMTALTPLLAANDEYEARHVKGAVQKEESEKIQLPESWGIQTPVDPDKKVLEPLRLPDGPDGVLGRVLISGRSLKGMLRHSLGALLAAPMERVREHTFSYRPSLIISDRNWDKWETLPAIVTKITSGKAHLWILKKLIHLKYKKEQAPGGLEFIHHTGIDGDCILGKLHEKKELASADRKRKISPVRNYTRVYVTQSDYGQGFQGEIYLNDESYQKTLDHLGDDKDGHLRKEHPLYDKTKFEEIKKRIQNMKKTPFQEGQVIFVEISKSKGSRRIASWGNHVYYRWRYAGTVRRKNGEERLVLLPMPKEKIQPSNHSNHIPPQELSAARLLFGYVSDDKNPGTKNIGQGDFQKLSGRLAFNMAVEQIQDPDPGKRFVNHDSECVVPLKILGQPRPSAAEFYLRQDEKEIKKRHDGGVMVTYGDLAGDDPVGELNGRKFYLHQPDAAKDPSCYMDKSEETVTGNQAALGRYVSQPGSTFRFTLRFRYLRPWELGALLFALEPERWIDRLLARLPDWKSIPSYVESIRAAAGRQPLFSLKLGHGRPLGLGSIQIHADRTLFLGTDQPFFEDDARLEQAIQSFAQKLGEAPEREEVLLQWLKIHRYAGRARADYPRVYKDNKRKTLKPGEQIFTYHQKLRQRHARGRRCQGPGNPDPDLLQPLD